MPERMRERPPEEQKALERLNLAKADLREAHQKLNKARGMIHPDSTLRTQEETAFFALAKLRVSKATKTAKIAEQMFYISKARGRGDLPVFPPSGDTESITNLQRMTNLLDELEMRVGIGAEAEEEERARAKEEQEREKMKQLLNPYGKPIEELPWAKEIAAAVKANEQQRKNREDILNDGLAIADIFDPALREIHDSGTPLVSSQYSETATEVCAACGVILKTGETITCSDSRCKRKWEERKAQAATAAIFNKQTGEAEKEG